MMPRLAALSMVEIIARASFGSGFVPGEEMPFCMRRRRVRTLRLREARAIVCRARLEADRVLAMVGKFVSGRVAEAARPVNRMRNYALRPKCGCSFNAFFTGRAGFSARFSGAGFSGGASDAIAATVVDSTFGSGAG